MASMAVSDNSITIVKGLHLDHYDYSKHTVIEVPQKAKPQDNDAISDVIISENCEYLALITSTSKQLLVYNLPLPETCKSFVLPRSASKIRFSSDNEHILVADKSGDALIYNIKDDGTGTKLLGHLSLLLDILQTNDEKFIITCDRDEKIRVSCYPNTYNIQTYCLGHKEFVNHIELLPHDDNYLTSTSGDGLIKCWNYVMGAVCHSIDTFADINDAELKEKFTQAMDSEGVEVNTLPIVHFTVTRFNETSSLLAVAVHTCNKLLVYKLETVNYILNHKLIDKLAMERFPAAVKFYKHNLYVYDEVESIVSIFKPSNDDPISFKLDSKVKMFENTAFNADVNENSHDAIKVLYKRKFDNVQEYQERKKQRLEKNQ